MHRFFIEPDLVKDGIATLTGQDAKHLVHVLRLTTGDRVALIDGKGYHYTATIKTITPKAICLTITDTRYLHAESPVHITMAQGVLKEKKMEALIRPLTELGMTEWAPFYAKRSVPTPTPKKDPVKVQRWERIVRESLKQCGRSLQPILHPPCTFQYLMDQSDGYDLKILFWEEAMTPLDILRVHQLVSSSTNHFSPDPESISIPTPASTPDHQFTKNPTAASTPHHKAMLMPPRIMILIGPEGGITKEEAKVATDHGFSTFTLGNRILKAETAAITALALIQNTFGDLGKKVQETA